jgi:hypothetical protein
MTSEPERLSAARLPYGLQTPRLLTSPPTFRAAQCSSPATVSAQTMR